MKTKRCFKLVKYTQTDNGTKKEYLASRYTWELDPVKNPVKFISADAAMRCYNATDFYEKEGELIVIEGPRGGEYKAHNGRLIWA